MLRNLFIPGFLILFMSACATPPKGKPIAPLLEGMGDHRHPISTEDPMAQRYFDQGLTLAWAFNHAEAERSFHEAARRDPGCALCWWGVALVLGPNINAAMEDAAVPKAYEAIQKALALADQASAKERAYILALAERYGEKLVADRSELDRAYAKAMGEVAKQYPEDMDAATLYAEALMDLHPWDYWTKDGKAQAWTPEILTTVEKVMERAPLHPGANHLYIHAMEASPHPERALASADRLRDLVPGAGHLVHMPAHIYIRTGRYHQAALANERATQVDRAYLDQVKAQGIYPLGYVPHNHHFILASAALEGRSQRAIEAAQHLAQHQDPQLMRQPGYGTLQHYWIMPLYTQVRFGQWEEILKAPKPDEELLYPTGAWHYARGMALVRQDELEAAARELTAVAALAEDPRLEEVTLWDINTTSQVLRIAREVLAGELDAARGALDQAIAHLEKGVALEDELRYTEPSDWHASVRQYLGAVLLKASRPAQAEKVYREDLYRNPENGWSLFGLAQSLRAQGKEEEALEIEQRFDQAWALADVELTSSRF